MIINTMSGNLWKQLCPEILTSEESFRNTSASNKTLVLKAWTPSLLVADPLFPSALVPLPFGRRRSEDRVGRSESQVQG